MQLPEVAGLIAPSAPDTPVPASSSLTPKQWAQLAQVAAVLLNKRPTQGQLPVAQPLTPTPQIAPLQVTAPGG